jgi:hypothetical protein
MYMFVGSLHLCVGVNHYLWYWDWKVTRDLSGLDFGQVVTETKAFWDKTRKPKPAQH